MITVGFLYTFLSNHVLVVGVISAIGGAIIADALKFREYRRSNLQSDLEKVEACRTPIDVSLGKFSEKALGRGDTSAEDLSDLRSRLSDMNSLAMSVKNRVPALAASFTRLSNSIVAVQKGAQGVSGPLDAKPFVQAVAEFYAASNDFFAMTIKRQQRWAQFRLKIHRRNTA